MKANCPNCGAPLTHFKDRDVCEYCGTMFNHENTNDMREIQRQINLLNLQLNQKAQEEFLMSCYTDLMNGNVADLRKVIAEL